MCDRSARADEPRPLFPSTPGDATAGGGTSGAKSRKEPKNSKRDQQAEIFPKPTNFGVGDGVNGSFPVFRVLQTGQFGTGSPNVLARVAPWNISRYFPGGSEGEGEKNFQRIFIPQTSRAVKQMSKFPAPINPLRNPNPVATG